MIGVDAVKAGLLLFFVAIIQVSLLSSVGVAGGTPNLLLVTLVAVALLRGSIFGAAGGFFGGLLIDTANLETLGLTSLILTLAGYWIGRYGETTGRDRTHAPYVSVAVVTILYAIGVLVLDFLLGDPVSGRRRGGAPAWLARARAAPAARAVQAAARSFLPTHGSTSRFGSRRRRRSASPCWERSRSSSSARCSSGSGRWTCCLASNTCALRGRTS